MQNAGPLFYDPERVTSVYQEPTPVPLLRLTLINVLSLIKLKRIANYLYSFTETLKIIGIRCFKFVFIFFFTVYNNTFILLHLHLLL